VLAQAQASGVVDADVLGGGGERRVEEKVSCC